MRDDDLIVWNFLIQQHNMVEQHRKKSWLEKWGNYIQVNYHHAFDDHCKVIPPWSTMAMDMMSALGNLHVLASRFYLASSYQLISYSYQTLNTSTDFLVILNTE